ncbi:hypothetical protein Taro_052599 [Colocasia esculenta]|uniref:Glycosyltransferase n=1 Tax=Colocasia esculenta TaxID=4460 RepID=A0A843XK81_COLES|nr:hypothetical protein [Colocasia esculenta]
MFMQLLLQFMVIEKKVSTFEHATRGGFATPAQSCRFHHPYHLPHTGTERHTREVAMGSHATLPPHAVVIPYPSQGHIHPMLQLAKLLHYRGFHITFVNTEFNHQRLVHSRGAVSVRGLDGFRFETIPDGLPPPERDGTQDIAALCASTMKHSLVPFRDLVTRLNAAPGVPPVTYIVADGAMSFTINAAEELGIPELLFFTLSACGVMGYLSYKDLVDRGYVPFKDESCLTNGYLETAIDWIPGMKGIRLKDLPCFLRTTDPDDIMLNANMKQAEDAKRAKGIILNTFEVLETDVLDAIRDRHPNLYTIGPLSPLCRQVPEMLASIQSSLWKEDTECLRWLDGQKEASVLYVNFGSIAVMSSANFMEFAWGIANSKQPFLWVVRPDLVMGGEGVLPEEFVEETRGRGLLASWCSQEQVLAHPATGCFLTHCGWNSTLEAVYEGVPLLCWPFWAEQTTNCRYACTAWGNGMEIGRDVRREEVEVLVREMISGEGTGKEAKRRAAEWKEKAAKAIAPGGSSHHHFERLVNDLSLINM